MAAIGIVEKFSPDQSWEEYCEIMTQYFVANSIIEPERQRATLLSGVGLKTYSLIRGLCQPRTPTDFSFKEIVEKVKNHLSPKPSAIVERCKFDNRTRKPGETVQDYVAELQKLSENCEFGQDLKNRMRDKLVSGINNEAIQRKLLSEIGLTFDTALRIATAMETAARHVVELQHGATAESKTVHNVSQRSQTFNRNRGRGRGKNTYQNRKPAQKQNKECFRCGGDHDPSTCWCKDLKCHHCSKKGHIKKMCRNLSKPKRDRHSSSAHRVEETTDREPSDEEHYTLYSVAEAKPQKRDQPIVTTVNINSVPISLEVDTGCSVTLISEPKFNELLKETVVSIKKSPVKLKSYTGDEIQVIGECDVSVTFMNRTKVLRLIVVKGTGQSLLGREWIRNLPIDLGEVKTVTSTVYGGQQQPQCSLTNILNNNSELFSPELGKIKGTTAKIQIDHTKPPKFFKARSVPFAMKQNVEKELDRLLTEGVIEPVKFSDWAAPIVAVRKPDSSVRICGDYKLTVNQASTVEQYPIPRVEDLWEKLSRGKTFSKLDLSHAYQQLVLDEDSRKYVTVNTHKGLFTYTRLPFGVSSAPAIFQRTIENLLQGIPHTVAYLDDISVTGKTEKEHLENLNTVLTRLKEADVRLKRQKCQFQMKEVIYLGHCIDEQGISPVVQKVEEIRNAPQPKSKQELQAYLGLLNFYHRFLPKASTILAPLHELLGKDVKWMWTKSQEQAFQESKQMLLNSDVLIHYDSDKPLILTCDASPYGAGAVLAHVMPDKSERPIMFASRTLTKAEKNYSQLDKEGCALIFGMKKFHKYVYGRHVTIVTDHKPLISLFNEHKAVPQMVSQRVQRWSIWLQAYNYNIVFRPGKSIANADALSRLPLPILTPNEDDTEETVLLIETLDSPPVTAEQISKWTKKDPSLTKVAHFIRSGWPDVIEQTWLKPYSNRRHELSVELGCVLWGSRVVIPSQGRAAMLSELHNTHAGITRMKGLARSYFWWPGMDAEIETRAKSCLTCQLHQKTPAAAPLHPWDWPVQPWKRLHVDYAGPLEGKMILITVDAHSKWIEASVTNSSTSTVTIQKLRGIFATHGLPETVVTDNGSCFTSQEFEDFMTQNGISHVLTSPYHPSSNGLAERAVGTVKDGLKKNKKGTMEDRINRHLFTYRITPHATTGRAPAELLMKRQLRSRLDLVVPSVKRKVLDKQISQVKSHDKSVKHRSFKVGDLVNIRNYQNGPKWIRGKVIEISGPLSYCVQLFDGRIMRRHVDQILPSHKSSESRYDPVLVPDNIPLTRSNVNLPVVSDQPREPIPDGRSPSKLPSSESSPESSEQSPIVANKYPVRVRKPPAYLKDYV